MKTCSVCNATLFDDMDTCYGCLHRFDAEYSSFGAELPNSTAASEEASPLPEPFYTDSPYEDAFLETYGPFESFCIPYYTNGEDDSAPYWATSEPSQATSTRLNGTGKEPVPNKGAWKLRIELQCNGSTERTWVMDFPSRGVIPQSS